MQITGADIRAARRRVGESQTEFGKRLGVDKSTVSLWESGGPPQEGTAPVLIERVLAELGHQPTEAAE